MSAACSDQFWAAAAWAVGLGLDADDPRAEPSSYGPRTWANFIPCRLDKSPLVREWRHLSAAGLRSPRLTSYELNQMRWRSARDDRPAAYAILPGSAGLVVVDVDDPALVPALLRLYGDTPVRTLTPSGGVHLYYLAPADPEAEDGAARVTSRTAVRGPRTYDVKAAGSMCHMPGGESHSGRYEATPLLRDFAPGELRAMLPTFPVAAYEGDWQAHHPEAEWTPQGDRADDFVLADGPEARAFWAEAVADIGPAEVGERHDKARRLALRLGDRGCPEEVALELLREWNARNASPEPDDRARAVVRDAYATRRSALGCWVPVDVAFDDDDAPEATAAEAATDEAPPPAPRARPAGGLPELDIADLFGGVPGAVDYFRAAAAHPILQVRPDIVAGFGLLLASAAIAGRAALQIGDITTPAYLYGFGECSAAEGKSLPLKLAGLDLLLEHQNALAASGKRQRTLAAVKRDRLQAEVDDLKRASKKLRGAEADQADEAIADRMEQIEALRSPALFFIGNSDSPQGLEARMRDCRYALLVAAEGTTVLRNFAAAQGDGAGAKDYLDPILYGYSEDDTGRGKIGEWQDEELRRMFKARCGLILALQPCVLAPESREDARLLSHLARRGLFSRTLLFRPQPYGAGETSPKSTDEQRDRLRPAWEGRIRGLLAEVPGHDHPLAPSNRTIVGCAAEARGLFDAFTDEMKRASRPGGELSGEFTGTVAGRAAEQAKRVALVLRLLRLGRVGACEVEADDARRAIRFVRDYVLPHAVAVAARAVYSPVDDDCEKLVELLRKVGGKVTRTAVLDRHLGRGWGKTERGSKARIDIAAEQGALLGRVRVSGTGAKGSPVTFELAAA